MTHLIKCGVIRNEFWCQVFALIEKLGFTAPAQQDIEIFVAVGCYTGEDGGIQAVAPELAGLMFIAWRCLYASIVDSRVEGKPLNLDHAYKRTLQMCITRLRAYGEKWLLWCRKNKYTGNKCIIPVDKQDRVVIAQDMLGAYTINGAFFTELNRVGAAAAPAAPRPRAQRAPANAQQTRRDREEFQPVLFQGTGPTTQTTMVQFMRNAA